jgi:general secretion pathway protein A
VLSELDRSKAECVLLSNPTLTRAEFYEFLTAGFKLSQEAANSKTRFLFELGRHLEATHAAGAVSAIVLDEAQSLPSELLEEVRLLSNIDTHNVKLLNVVLAGQPELAGRLNEPSLRQLKQRIGLRCELAPLDFAETAAYIAGRIRIAGGDPAAIFSREAILAIHDSSGGVARTINVICDNALIGGFAAQTKPVTRALVQEVCRDFDLRGSAPAEDRPAEPRATLRLPPPVLMPPRQPVDLPEAPMPAPSPQAESELFGQVGRRRFRFF